MTLGLFIAKYPSSEKTSQLGRHATETTAGATLATRYETVTFIATATTQATLSNAFLNYYRCNRFTFMSLNVCTVMMDSMDLIYEMYCNNGYIIIQYREVLFIIYIYVNS